MKIKTEKQMNLPQLIEWAWGNDVRDKNLLSDNATPLRINIGGDFIFNNDYVYSKNDTFTVEVEEEITEDTVIPKLVVNHRDTGFTIYENDYINNEFPLDSVQAFYILNTDRTMTLIWRNGKLVE